MALNLPSVVVYDISLRARSLSRCCSVGVLLRSDFVPRPLLGRLKKKRKNGLFPRFHCTLSSSRTHALFTVAAVVILAVDGGAKHQHREEHFSGRALSHRHVLKTGGATNARSLPCLPRDKRESFRRRGRKNKQSDVAWEERERILVPCAKRALKETSAARATSPQTVKRKVVLGIFLMFL